MVGRRCRCPPIIRRLLHAAVSRTYNGSFRGLVWSMALCSADAGQVTQDKLRRCDEPPRRIFSTAANGKLFPLSLFRYIILPFSSVVSIWDGIKHVQHVRGRTVASKKVPPSQKISVSFSPRCGGFFRFYGVLRHFNSSLGAAYIYTTFFGLHVGSLYPV